MSEIMDTVFKVLVVLLLAAKYGEFTHHLGMRDGRKERT